MVVYRTLGLGDLLTAVPALRALARAHPDHHLVLATPAWLGPLAAAIDAVDEHLPLDELAPLPGRFDGCELAVNLHGSGPQSHAVLRQRRPQQLLAFRHPEVADHAGPAWDPHRHEVARWCDLVRWHGQAADEADLHLDAPPGPVPAGVAGATVIHPGAKAPARRWPPERFAAVAAAERVAGRPVVVTGSAGEGPLARRVARLAGLDDRAVLAGACDLGGLARIVAAAARVVCGDTGVGHLATAVGTPSVLLFGPTSPAAWGPPPSERHRVLWAGRRGDPLAQEPFAGLLQIDVTDVLRELQALDHVPGRSGPAPRGVRS